MVTISLSTLQQHLKNKGNPKGIWNAIKTLNGSTKKSSVIQQLTIEENTLSDKHNIAEAFNEYFSEISTHILKDNDQTTKEANTLSKLKEFISSSSDKLSSEYKIPAVLPQDVQNIIEKKISTNKATGADGLSAKLLKLSAPVLAQPLAKIINISISTNIVPQKWKIAKITPIHKTGAADDRNNFRPISVLPVISKIMEKHVADSLTHHLQENNYIYPLQSGFRKYHSTETALIKLTDDLLFNMDNNMVSGLLLIDLRKAFDLVDHTILTTKLSVYNISPEAIKWFTSYLTDRTQFVTIEKFKSSTRPIKRGVPQGSILGPILFNVFINDLFLDIKNSNVNIYADDTTLTARCCWNNLTIDQSLSNDIESISQWCTDNNMVINTDKTKSMLVAGKRLRKKIIPSDQSLSINHHGKNIEQSTCEKLLGVYVDQDLTFDTHIENLCRQLSKRIGLLRRIRPFLTTKQRIIYYNAIIKPTMLYCCSIWTCTSKSNLDQVLKLQKRAARTILDAQRTANSVDLFNRLKWIPFYEEASIKRCTLVHKRLNGEVPAYIDELLVTNNHGRNTRYSQINLRCPSYKYETEGGKTFSVRTTKEWNNLNSSIKTSETLSKLKSHLYKNIFERQKVIDHF